MEFLTALKLLSDAGNAETTQELQQQFNQLAAAHNGFVGATRIIIAFLAVVMVTLTIIFTYSAVSDGRKIHSLERKVDKLTALVEKAAGVAIIE